jgi:glycosyltransferase involved in cell wall biosynthesis
MENPRSSAPLRIAVAAPLFTTVPPAIYGGTERIIHWLTEELVCRGHDVTLFATGNSHTSGRLHPTRDESLFETWGRGDPFRYDFAHVSNAVEVLRRSSEFDIVHFQMGAFSAPFAALSAVPTLHSMPSALHPDDLWLVERYPEAAMTARSHSQISDLPEWRRRQIFVVPNGCDFNRFSAPEGPGRYLAFLGRMSPEKNPADAIRLALRADMPIVLAGDSIDSDDQSYFDAEVRPLIDGRMVTWIGGVDDRQKNEFLRDAAVLLFPILCEEAFGIVMIEAMACGVPVLAYNHGAVSEVVDLGITGYYDDSFEEVSKLLPAALRLDRMSVRDHARRRFSREVMTNAYMRVYESLLAGAGHAQPASA